VGKSRTFSYKAHMCLTLIWKLAGGTLTFGGEEEGKKLAKEHTRVAFPEADSLIRFGNRSSKIGIVNNASKNQQRRDRRWGN